jgi:hypothetical protein
VIHDFFAATFTKCFANSRADFFEGLRPLNTLPLAFAALTRSLQWIQDSVSVMNLVDRGWTLSAVATTARRVMWIALELLDFTSFFVNVREQTAARFAIEARSGDQAKAPFRSPSVSPFLGVEFDPVGPLFRGWVTRERGARQKPLEIGYSRIREVFA